MFINITDSETGNNLGSCAALIHYLEKENRLIGEEKPHPELWFNGQRKDAIHQEVRVKIDNNRAKLGKNDAKFYLINISPSQKEIAHLKEQFGEQRAEQKLKDFAIHIMDEYARNFKREGIESNIDLLWYGKLEHYRYYSHADPEVKSGHRKEGERKEGDQMHVQVVVSRKDITDKIKLSPMNNSRGKNTEHSAKLGQFDRKAFKQSGETLFDTMFGYNRELKDTMIYALTMKGSNMEEKKHFYAQQTDENDRKFPEPNIEILRDPNNTQEQGVAIEFSGGLLDNLLSSDPGSNEQNDLHAMFQRKKKKKRPPGQNN
ncbi:DUF5712 family protein [Chitinophaga sp. 22321]|uniref:Molybdopterin-guanine dinucleotide biosynthesis protein MobB n=1 Tax=Chitinophaga hostae TaxID=2831022 RepID=A0ABS5IWG2_9BACT|nr:DUF5712 family protein [Chitinophaga hostae]MBS0027256.1 hypothetical protein [Chitinophaga hostae]